MRVSLQWVGMYRRLGCCYPPSPTYLPPPTHLWIPPHALLYPPSLTYGLENLYKKGDCIGNGDSGRAIPASPICLHLADPRVYPRAGNLKMMEKTTRHGTLLDTGCKWTGKPLSQAGRANPIPQKPPRRGKGRPSMPMPRVRGHRCSPESWSGAQRRTAPPDTKALGSPNPASPGARPHLLPNRSPPPTPRRRRRCAVPWAISKSRSLRSGPVRRPWARG